MSETEAAAELRGAAAPLLREGHRLLVLGGSCTVAVGMCAALVASGRTPRLICLDRHFDLNILERSLSWMGMVYCHGMPATWPALADLGDDGPLLTPDNLVYLGVDHDAGTAWEVDQQQALAISVV